jgi:hypothetical protein
MSQTLDADAVDERPKLGLGFWLPWLAGLAAIAAVFVAGMWMLAPRMGSIWGSVAGGTGVIAFTLALIGYCFLPRRTLRRRGFEDRMRPAARRYMWRFLPAMMSYVAVLIVAISYANAAEPSGVAAWLVALAPAVPLLFAIRAVALFLIEEDDEYLRERLYRQVAAATALTLAVCTVWGFLDLFGVVPHVELWVVFPIWGGCLVPAQFLLQRRSR